MDWLQVSNKIEGEIELNISGLIGGGFFDEGVTSDKIQADIAALTEQLGTTPKRINVNITNSPGGSVFHALAIFDLLTTNKAEVITNGIGLVASAATIIHQSGGKGRRNLTPNARYLVHRIQGQLEGTPAQIDEQNNEMKSLENQLIEVYSKCNTADKTNDEIFNIMCVNNGMGELMTTTQAIENGFADKEIKTIKVAACMSVDAELSAKLNIPVIENEITINFDKMKITNEEISVFEKIWNSIKGLGKSEPKNEMIVCAYCNAEMDTATAEKTEGGNYICPTCKEEVTATGAKVEVVEVENTSIEIEKYNNLVSEKTILETAKVDTENKLSDLQNKFNELEAKNTATETLLAEWNAKKEEFEAHLAMIKKAVATDEIQQRDNLTLSKGEPKNFIDEVTRKMEENKKK